MIEQLREKTDFRPTILLVTLSGADAVCNPTYTCGPPDDMPDCTPDHSHLCNPDYRDHDCQPQCWPNNDPSCNPKCGPLRPSDPSCFPSRF